MASPAGGSGSGAVGSTAQLAWTRRKTLVKTYDIGEIIETEDPTQMMADPTAKITTTLGNGLKRKVDDVIIEAATGNALDGDGNNVALPASQIIGSATTIISMDTLVEVGQTFLESDVDPDEAKVLVISPVQYRTLMNIEKLTSADYQSLQALSSGYLPNFLGFSHVILSNRLTAPVAGQIYCLAFTQNAIGLHVSSDVKANVAPRPDMSFAWQFYAAMSLDAVRVEDERIVAIHLKDAQV